MAKLLALSALVLSAFSLVSGGTIPAPADLELNTKRDTFSQCYSGSNGDILSRRDVQYCIDWLKGLKTTKSTDTLVCARGEVRVTVYGTASTSYASDIAAGVQWVHDQCKIDSDSVGSGQSIANGNADAQVLVKRFNPASPV